MASKTGREDSIKLNQDLDMHVGLLNEDDQISHKMTEDRSVWVQIARRSTTINRQEMTAGDGASIDNEKMITFDQNKNAEMILFDMKKH